MKAIEETICINIEKSRVPLEGSILSTSPSSPLPLCDRALSRPGEVKMVRCEQFSHCLLSAPSPRCLMCLASSHQFPHLLLPASVVALISTHKLGVEIRNILITLLDIWLKHPPCKVLCLCTATTLKFHWAWLWRGDKNSSPQEGFVFQFLLKWLSAASNNHLRL